jgi:hypothetical protein
MNKMKSTIYSLAVLLSMSGCVSKQPASQSMAPNTQPDSPPTDSGQRSMQTLSDLLDNRSMTNLAQLRPKDAAKQAPEETTQSQQKLVTVGDLLQDSKFREIVRGLEGSE